MIPDDPILGEVTEIAMSALVSADVLKPDEPQRPTHYNRAWSAIYQALKERDRVVRERVETVVRIENPTPFDAKSLAEMSREIGGVQGRGSSGKNRARIDAALRTGRLSLEKK